MYTIGVSGTIGEYSIQTLGDLIQVEKNSEVVTVRTVKELGRFIRRAQDLKLGLAFFADFDVIYIYDAADGNYGYAVNVKIEEFSEWGRCPL